MSSELMPHQVQQPLNSIDMIQIYTIWKLWNERWRVGDKLAFTEINVTIPTFYN